MKLPNGQNIELRDCRTRQIVVPIGTTLRVPNKDRWIVVALACLPTHDYAPPCGGDTRNVAAWGELHLKRDNGEGEARISVLTLMDRYWGRYNLLATYPDAIAKLEHLAFAVQTAPKLDNLLVALEQAQNAVVNYTAAIAPTLQPAVLVEGGHCLTVEYAERPTTAGRVAEVQLFDGTALTRHINDPIDVEITVIISSPVE